MLRLSIVVFFISLVSLTLCLPADSNLRIIGGEDAAVGASPYMASFSTSALTYAHVCAGVIIGKQWILTVAHCFSEMNKNGDVVGLSVYAGIQNREDYENGQKRTIDFAYKHKSFNGEIGSDDIALVHVSEPFVFSDKVRYATLPYADEEFDGEASATYGWGLDKADGVSYVSNLQVGKGKVLNATNCRGVLPNDAPLSDKQVCVQVSACYGDGGSPLIANRDAWPSVIVGLTSWGYVPCGSDRPTVYTNVAEFTKWIAEIQLAHKILY